MGIEKDFNNENVKKDLHTIVKERKKWANYFVIAILLLGMGVLGILSTIVKFLDNFSLQLIIVIISIFLPLNYINWTIFI